MHYIWIGGKMVCYSVRCSPNRFNSPWCVCVLFLGLPVKKKGFKAVYEGCPV